MNKQFYKIRGLFFQRRVNGLFKTGGGLGANNKDISVRQSNYAFLLLELGLNIA
jgi:hypothetical protein